MIISVSQYGNLIKGIIDSEPIVSRLSVRGEVAEFRRSGESAWFTIKDEFSRMSCFCFTLTGELPVGETVVVTGNPSYYPKSGNLSFYAASVTRENKRGDLLIRLNELKNRLEKEGVFENRRQVNRYAPEIGVVTSATGAAVRDIIEVAVRRNPGVSITVFPSKVQGEGAAESLKSGVEFFSASDVDTVIVARGGGSKEDLTAFNDEALVRAVFACKKPVISAVGHEIDYTLCDFAADLRAPTPSAAAELATVDMALVKDELQDLILRAQTVVRNLIPDAEAEISSSARYAGEVFRRRLSETEAKLDSLKNRAVSAVNAAYSDEGKKLGSLCALSEAVSPMKLLRKGFAALSVNGETLTEDKLAVGTIFDARMRDAAFTAKITEVIREEKK